MIRFPIPECWIYMFRVEKHFRYGSVKSAHRRLLRVYSLAVWISLIIIVCRTGKIKGIERILGTMDNLQESLIEVTSGQAKYEHQHRAIVWRCPRLPKEGQGSTISAFYWFFNILIRRQFRGLHHSQYGVQNSVDQLRPDAGKTGWILLCRIYDARNPSQSHNSKKCQFTKLRFGRATRKICPVLGQAWIQVIFGVCVCVLFGCYLDDWCNKGGHWAHGRGITERLRQRHLHGKAGSASTDWN